MSDDGDRIRVLHVDDDPDFVETAAAFVEREDGRFDVKVATSAAEGLDRLDDEPFECVVSDYDMPRRNGIEFLEAVREEHPDLPFVLYTGKGSEEVASDAISAGVTDYLQKGGGTSQYTVLANRIRNAVDRHQARTELADREKRLNLFFEQSPLGVIEWNERFEVVRINGAAEDILGYARDDLVGRSWEAIVPESDRDGVADIVADLLENEGGYHSVNENVRADGERIVCEWHNRVVTDDTGEVVAIFSQFQDVTERRRQERENVRRRHRLEQVLKTVPGCVVQLDVDGEVVFADERAEEVLGRDSDDMIGRAYDDPEWQLRDLSGDPVPDEQLPFCRVRDTGEPVHGVKHTLEWPDGSRRVLRVNGAPVFDDGGAVDSVVLSLVDITDQQDRERELARTRRRLELALETTDTGVWEWDLATDEVVWSESLERSMGLDPGEFEGTFEAFADRVHPDDFGRVREQIERAIETGSMYKAEFRMRHADGSYRWIEVRGQIVRRGDNDRLVGVHHDITDRKQREQELRRSRERYRTLVDHFPNGAVFLYDEGLECVLAGGQELSELGIAVEDIEGRRPRDRYPTEIGEEIETNLERAFEGEHNEFEQGYEGREYRVQTVPSSEGPVDYVMAVSQNVTDRKQYERKLTALHDVATDLANAESIGQVYDRTIAASEEILAFDRSAIDSEEGGVLSKVASSEAMSPDEMTDMSVENGIAGKTYRTRESYLIDDVHEHGEADPQGPYSSVLSIPIGDHGVFQAVAREPGAFDEEDLELAELLISHATSAVDRLARSRELQRQNERLENFASIVSHDLRSPLGVVEGRLKLAREECDSDHLDTAEDALKRSQALIEDLLTLAREGQRVDEIEPVLLREVVENCWQTVETADGRIVTEVDPERSVRADRSRLVELLDNLIRNAVKHAGEDVTVTVGDLADGFYVADDGPGIAEADREQVFEPGYSTVDGGTGFGLNIVREIAQAHGWEIGVTESREGGARFEITGVGFVE